MLKVGITGGIGTGKSTVARVFQVLGIPVYEADDRAKELIESDLTIRAGITRLLGKDAYLEDGEYNRRLVASKVFENKSLLKQINQIVHPVVIKDFLKWADIQDSQLPYVIKEAAIMDKKHSGVDRIIAVSSPLELRISRIKTRDGRPEDEIEKIIKNQISEEEYLSLADFEIHNNEEEFIVPQALQIDKKLREISGLF